MLGRYGGEEFAVIIPKATETGVAVVAERLRTAVSELRLEHEAKTVRVTVSIGGKTWNPDDLRGCEFAALVEPSDANLYAAKKAGRNRTIVDP